MERKTAIIVLAATFIIAAGLIAASTAGSRAPAAGNYTSTTQSHYNSSNVLFSQSQYFSYSYLVSSANLSQQAKSALAGYNLTRTPLGNGSVNITISQAGSSNGQRVTLQPGYKMYIVETSFGDDSFGKDFSYSDDGFLIVDPNGYIA